MDNEVLKTALESFINVYAQDAKDIFGDIFTRGKQFLNFGLKKYLEKHQTRYIFIKTLLHGNTPKYLYDIYYHLRIFQTPSVFKQTQTISNIFAPQINCVSIIGEAGSGKSTLIKHLFLNSIETKFGIPILVELRHLNDNDGDLEQYIYETLLEEDIVVDSELVRKLLRKGKFIFFLDGFDELNSIVKLKAIKSINSFVNRFIKNKYIITSRPKADAEYLPLFHTYRIGKLNTIQEISGFIKKQLRGEDELTHRIIESIKTGNQVYIFSFLSNPLILSLYIHTFQTNSLLPAKKHIFYQRVINALFSEHDSKSKMGFDRERYSKMTQEPIEEVLAVFCLYSFFDNKYEWDSDYIINKLKEIKELPSFIKYKFDNTDYIRDLSLGVSLWTDDGGYYSFAHRTIQEFYVAKFIKNLKAIENEKFYSLLLEKYISTGNHPYLISLLSFLEEMDTYNLLTNFRLPILRSLKIEFDLADKDTRILNYLEYFGYAYEGDGILSRGYLKKKSGYIEKYINTVLQVDQELSLLYDETNPKSEELESFDESEEVSGERRQLEIRANIEDKKWQRRIKGKAIFSDDDDFVNDLILPKIEIFIKRLSEEIQEIESYISIQQRSETNILEFLKSKS
jgi:hypothetical protein